ncbi:MAG: hypothetical protein ACKPKO_27690, partial [Candidatus Fonsibacter sp.]
RLVGTCPNNKKKPATIPRSSLAEIDISKAYTGAFIRIKSIPVFNEFDTWQAYKAGGSHQEHEPIYSGGKLLRPLLQQEIQPVLRLLSEADEKLPRIKAVKHPSIIKKVSYKGLIEEPWRTPISDNPEEDAVLKKTIANCNYGMLEKTDQ